MYGAYDVGIRKECNFPPYKRIDVESLWNQIIQCRENCRPLAARQLGLISMKTLKQLIVYFRVGM